MRLRLGEAELAAFLDVPWPPEAADAAGPTVADWDAAVGYRDLMRRHLGDRPRLEEIHRRAVRAVLARARRQLRQFSEQTQRRPAPWPDWPWGEVNLESTLESWTGRWPPAPSEIVVERPAPVERAAGVMIDTSLSMRGERFAMALVGVAILVLNLPVRLLAVITFDDRARVVKRFRRPMTAAEIVGRTLQTPPRGCTNIGAALREAVRLAGRCRVAGAVNILLTDGHQTAGPNPLRFAASAAPLMVLPLDASPACVSACAAMARRGGGAVIPVRSPDMIPAALWRVSERLKRGAASPRARRGPARGMNAP